MKAARQVQSCAAILPFLPCLLLHFSASLQMHISHPKHQFFLYFNTPVLNSLKNPTPTKAKQTPKQKHHTNKKPHTKLHNKYQHDGSINMSLSCRLFRYSNFPEKLVWVKWATFNVTDIFSKVIAEISQIYSWA